MLETGVLWRSNPRGLAKEECMRLELICVSFVALCTISGTAALPSSTPDPLPSTPSSRIESVRLEREGCLARCPQYTLIFWSDGTAVYQGERYVDKVGTFYGKADFPIIAAWLDAEHVDRYAPRYALNWLDAEGMRLTIERAGSNSTTIITNNTEYLPWQIQGVLAGIDGFGDRVRWQDVSTLEPVMGYAYYREHDKEYDQIDVYPGGGPDRIEATLESNSTRTCGSHCLSTWLGRASLTRAKQHDTFEGTAIDLFGDLAAHHKMRIIARSGGLSVTMDGRTHAFTHSTATEVQRLGEEFARDATGPEPNQSKSP